MKENPRYIANTYTITLLLGGDCLQIDNKRLDIAKNIKIVEWLKCEILTSVSDLFNLLVKGTKNCQDSIADCLASIIVASYLMGKRLGIHFGEIDNKIDNKIHLGILDNHEIEKSFGDLTSLKQHIKDSSEIDGE